MDKMYPGAEDEASPSETDGEVPEKKMDDKEDGETALLPKSFFEGKELKPGDQFYVEIVRQYEDEVEVKYPHQMKGEEGNDHSEANEKLDEMGTEAGGNPGGSSGY